jgi:hypothetical protein
MNNQVFEIVQAMSGQGNCITIPGPYLDFFAGDRQQHLLAAILNQLVFWSGKSSLDDGWFTKSTQRLRKRFAPKMAMWSEKQCSRLQSSTWRGLLRKNSAGKRHTEEALSGRSGSANRQNIPARIQINH